jgi:UDP-N-acetylglucosamine--N-acetylmuramyl-(pentapeptide) pyrophosphoryl-undecaprenol N-acetylglucosamine transferase
MKIVFTGGGTGGHFYPIIAVAEKVNEVIDREKIIDSKLYYISSSPYDKELLFEHGLIYEEVTAGKMRTYGSWRNFTDLFKIAFGTLNALFKLFSIYPDVVFGKGGYASLPTIIAARILGIPVVIHESDSTPGRVNKWAGKFAKKVAVSFKETAEFFPKNKVAWTGQPIRTALENPSPREEALKYFKLESGIPVILLLGGSQGAELLNNTLLAALPRLVEKYQVIHQTGVLNFKSVRGEADVILADNQKAERYHSVPFLNSLGMKMGGGAADMIVSRAGSTLFEIARFGVPSILVPFTESNGDHARKNAFSYAHAGGCNVIEEANLTSNILVSEIENLLNDKAGYAHMQANAKAFGKPGAALAIAEALIEIALSHQR